jgi:hypothetical protein
MRTCSVDARVRDEELVSVEVPFLDVEEYHVIHEPLGVEGVVLDVDSDQNPSP